jgi:hypothetical protein
MVFDVIFGYVETGLYAEDHARLQNGLISLVSRARQSLLMRVSAFRILVSSLRLLTAFILMTMKALRMPMGFLGGLP